MRNLDDQFAQVEAELSNALDQVRATRAALAGDVVSKVIESMGSPQQVDKFRDEPNPLARQDREAQVLCYLRDYAIGGRTVRDIAEATGTSRTYLYRLLPRLVERSLVRTDRVPAGTRRAEQDFEPRPLWYRI